MYRLYTEDAYHHHLPDRTVPEIRRSNLAPVVLHLKAMGSVYVILPYSFFSLVFVFFLGRGLFGHHITLLRTSATVHCTVQH